MGGPIRRVRQQAQNEKWAAVSEVGVPPLRKENVRSQDGARFKSRRASSFLAQTMRAPQILRFGGSSTLGLPTPSLTTILSLDLMRLISGTNKRRYAFKPVSSACSGSRISLAGATQLEIAHHPLDQGHAGLTRLTA